MHVETKPSLFIEMGLNGVKFITDEQPPGGLSSPSFSEMSIILLCNNYIVYNK